MATTQSVNTFDKGETPQRLKILNIQRTCVYDGPGIRSTIFFQGCNLRCLWCQNPEGQSFQGKTSPDDNSIDYTDYTINDIMEVIMRDKEYYFSTDGGVTLSGGEPFLQNPDALISLLKLFKQEKIKVSAETCLHAPWKNIKAVAPYIDLFLVDLKVVGDEDLHMKLTKQDSTLIHSNIKKLLELKAKVKFRMVMVPGYTDSENQIQKTTDYLKSIKYDSIELMKFHNMYEGKFEKYGLEQVSLNITPEQSLLSIEKSLKLFRQKGIKATNVDLDSPKPKDVFSPRTKFVQADIRKSPRALCLEVAKLKTKYYKKNKGSFEKPVHIHRAERLKYVLENKKTKIYPQELLAGSFTEKRVAGQLWEEYYGTLDILYLHKINRQKPVKFQLSFKDKMSFYFKIFPFWRKHSLIKHVFPKFMDIIKMLAHGAQLNVGFLNNIAAIAHYVVNFERILQLGTTGLMEEIKATMKAKPENNQDFYKGTLIALEGLEIYAQRYAEALIDLSKIETDPERRKELEKMAEICQYVPKNPARTFHEALQCMTFVQIALCIESYENAISYGRMDQILYPYYKKDKEAGIINYEQACELICLFVLKMDQAILVNDGESVLSLSKLFETLSTDQSITFGGVGKDGEDATNEVTFMLMDACELQPLSINMTARIHKNSPAAYLERLAELYIGGCPMPELFSDEIYIESLQRHYSTTLEDARNYSIVGCVEPCASDNHFGNTDCGNINLALPLLQAIKGHEHELWNDPRGIQWEKLVTNTIEFMFKGKYRFSRWVRAKRYNALKRRKTKRGHYTYNPPSSFEELLERFQARLNAVTTSLLKDHQFMEKKLRENCTTPLCSSLYSACVENGKDAYEGGTTFNSSGIQAVGVTDVADSFHALEEVIYKQKLYTIDEIINAIENNFEGDLNQQIKAALLAVPKFGDDSSQKAIDWVSKVMQMWNIALDSVTKCPRNGQYTAGYYALNVGVRYGKKTQALPSGRLEGVPLANSVTPHYGMEASDLFSSLNSIAGVNFTDYAVNGTTVTFTVDSALFQGPEGVKNLASIFKTFLTKGGMQFQPNVVSREILLDAFKNPEKHKYLMVRVAGYCAYFYELTDELKQIIINRTCYS
jgi:pyruvate formate-lyase/glycerol dehydratase family glycyl radical enzyme